MADHGLVLVIHQVAEVVGKRSPVHGDQSEIEAERCSCRFLIGALVGYSLAGEIDSEANRLAARLRSESSDSTRIDAPAEKRAHWNIRHQLLSDNAAQPMAKIVD